VRKRNTEDSGPSYNWMDTYGDMVTLMLTFFVLLFSMSSVNQKKWEMLVEAFRSNGKEAVQIVIPTPSDLEPGDEYVAPNPGQDTTADQSQSVEELTSFDDLYQYLMQYVQQKDLGGDIELFKGDGYTFITFRNNIFFEPDSAVLLNDGKKILDYLMDALSKIPGEVGEIRAYGHTAQAYVDTVNNAQVDFMLSSNRAAAVVSYMISKEVLDPFECMMISEGRGMYDPIVPHDGTEETRQQNRRVEIYIAKKDSSPATLEEIYKDVNGTEAGGSAVSEGK